LYDAYGVGRLVLELLWGDVDDCVGDEFAFVWDCCPRERLVEAFVAEGSGWQVDFSAVRAFACHEFALREELVELFDGEGFCAHCWLLL
jgi:hypothetical protein